MIAKLEESQKNAERDWNEAEALRKQSENFIVNYNVKSLNLTKIAMNDY